MRFSRWRSRYCPCFLKRKVYNYCCANLKFERMCGVCIMTAELNYKIENRPQISAIYYALLQCRYDFYSYDRDDAHIAVIKSFADIDAVPPFFSAVKQTTCSVYPYWPRAAILETATFFLDSTSGKYRDFETFRSRILSASNISPEEKGASLWNWIIDFPVALASVMRSGRFQRYMDWENNWIAAQNNKCAEELRSLEDMLRYCPQAGNARIILSPIKCVYFSDYFADRHGLAFILGALRKESIVHECLHPVVHSLLERAEYPVEKAEYPGIDKSYYQDKSSAGYLNAFEEYAVRKLTEDFLLHNYPRDIKEYLRGLAKPQATIK